MDIQVKNRPLAKQTSPGVFVGSAFLFVEGSNLEQSLREQIQLLPAGDDRATVPLWEATICELPGVQLEQDKFSSALKLANCVVQQLNHQGRLYSTLDSVAAIALMNELQAADLVNDQSQV